MDSKSVGASTVELLPIGITRHDSRGTLQCARVNVCILVVSGMSTVNIRYELRRCLRHIRRE